MGEPITVALPAGFYKNGTPYSAKNRWVDGNLVRWNNGALTAIGGWERRLNASGVAIAALYADPTIEATRNILVWELNDGNGQAVFGTNRGLYALSPSGIVTDVTPAGFTPGEKDETKNRGYGGFFYGIGAYGVQRPDTGTALPAFTWELDTWGEEAIASQRNSGSTLYKWAVGDAAFTSIAGAPTNINGFVVTDHRFIMTFGSLNDPRLVQWCNREDYATWTATVSNQAGSRRLEGKGKLLTGKNILGGVLILSETDAFFARYINPPFIYGFERVGLDCGPISPNAIILATDLAMWIGKDSFFMFDGRVSEVHCEVSDYYLNDRSPNALSKTTAMHVAKFNEFWWLYQSTNGTELDSYISYNYLEKIWTVGRLDRTVGREALPFTRQMLVSPDGLIYNHELSGVSPAGATPYAETGPLEIDNGKHVLYVQRVYPDEDTIGEVTMTIYGKDMPTGSERTYGPYTLTNPTPVRARGRQIRMRVDQVSQGWKVGNGMRFEIAELTAAGVR